MGSSGSLLEFARDFESRRGVVRLLHEELVKARDEAQRPYLLRRRALPFDRCTIQDLALIGLSSLVDIVDSGAGECGALVDEIACLFSPYKPLALYGEWCPSPSPPEAPLALEPHKCFSSTLSSPSNPPSAVLVDSPTVWESVRSTSSASSRLEHWGVLVPTNTLVSSVFIQFDTERAAPSEILLQGSTDGDTYVTIKTVRVTKDCLAIRIPADMMAVIAIRIQARPDAPRASLWLLFSSCLLPM